MSDEVKLANCPSCGGSASLFDEGHQNVFWIECNSCEMRTDDALMLGGRDRIIAAWNRRSDPALLALREAREWLNEIYRSDDDWSPKGRERAGDLCERIDAILSGQAEYPESVRKLVEAAKKVVTAYDNNSGHEPSLSVWQVSTDVELRSALAPFKNMEGK